MYHRSLIRPVGSCNGIVEFARLAEKHLIVFPALITQQTLKLGIDLRIELDIAHRLKILADLEFCTALPAASCKNDRKYHYCRHKGRRCSVFLSSCNHKLHLPLLSYNGTGRTVEYCNARLIQSREELGSILTRCAYPVSELSQREFSLE